MPTDVCGKRIEVSDVGTFVLHPASPSPHAGLCGGTYQTPAGAKQLKEALRNTNRARVEEAHLEGVSAGMQNMLVSILNRLDKIEDDAARAQRKADRSYEVAAVVRDELEDLKLSLKKALGFEPEKTDES